jgi:hypothetical protein
VGARIHDLLWRSTHADFDRALDARLDDDGELKRLWARLHVTRKEGRDKVDPQELDRILSDIQAEIEEGVLQGQRYVPGPTQVGRGLRKPIIASVARDIAQRLGKPFTYDMAERCLEEYRALQRRIDKDMEGYEPGIMEHIEPGDLSDEPDEV